jgi:nucleotide-binding universal stress UspA family protein
MFAQKILFPTDFSPASEEAIRWATSLCRDTGATMLIVHVEEPPMAYGGGELYYGLEDDTSREELRKNLASVIPTDATVSFEHMLLVGDPAKAIADIAESQHADMIVLGTHGRTGITRFLMGSVAEAVVRKAKCPVLTIKQPAEVHAGV